jgi:hypothetical protein
MRSLLLAAVLCAVLSACSLIENVDGQAELTSPCVGTEGSPCGPKRPVNLWLYGEPTDVL